MMRSQISALLCFVLGFQALPAQEAAPKLRITIVEGEGAINNIKQRVNREPIVQVEDENRRPVAGAVVVFFLPDRGPSGVFPNGSTNLTVVTDSQGRAAARGIRFNNANGQMQIRVNASYQGNTASAIITQNNVAAAAAAAGGGISAKLIAILAIGAAAGAGAGIWAAQRGNGGATPPGPTVLTPGTPTVGGPR
jgi:hypothetical protein